MGLQCQLSPRTPTHLHCIAGSPTQEQVDAADLHSQSKQNDEANHRQGLLPQLPDHSQPHPLLHHFSDIRPLKCLLQHLQRAQDEMHTAVLVMLSCVSTVTYSSYKNSRVKYHVMGRGLSAPEKDTAYHLSLRDPALGLCKST